MNAAEAYEGLRAAVLRAEPLAGRDLNSIRHCGLASWLSGWRHKPLAVPAGSRAPSKASPLSDPPPVTRELIQLLAGLVVTLVKDPAHA